MEQPATFGKTRAEMELKYQFDENFIIGYTGSFMMMKKLSKMTFPFPYA